MGTGKGTTIKEIVEIAGKILDINPKINYLPARPGEIGNFEADTTKLKRLFGSVPDTPLVEGLGRHSNGWPTLIAMKFVHSG